MTNFHSNCPPLSFSPVSIHKLLKKKTFELKSEAATCDLLYNSEFREFVEERMREVLAGLNNLD